MSTRVIRPVGILFAALVFALSLAGCNTASKADELEVGADFLGDWVFVAFSEGEQTDEEAEAAEALGDAATAKFEADGAAQVDIAGDIESGTWEAESDTTATFENEEHTANLELKGGKLVLSEGDSIMVFVRPGDR